jgi:hypothetical protein
MANDETYQMALRKEIEGLQEKLHSYTVQLNLENELPDQAAFQGSYEAALTAVKDLLVIEVDKLIAKMREVRSVY